MRLNKNSQNYNEKKLKELILYVAMKCEQQVSFGSVKLNKLLFFADFEHFRTHGRSITGATYVKLEHGPGPNRMTGIKKDLENTREAFERKEQLSGTGFEQKRLLALRKPDLTLFDGEEIATVDAIIERYAKHTGAALSEISHQFIGWQLARPGEAIPYGVASIPDKPLPLRARDIEFAKSVAARIEAQPTQ